MQKNEKVTLTQNVVLTQSENRFDICKLVNTLDSSQILKPTAVSFAYAQNRALISFDFSKSKTIKDADCFVLVCDEPATRASLFMTAQEHKYCFSASAAKQCNPYARAKLDNGKCVCPAPYSGELCESCLPGSVSKMQNRHTICSTTKQELECNGFGTFSRGECQCDNLHTGDKCEKCVNETFAYPDCSGDYLTDVTSSKYLQSFDELRREKVYTHSIFQMSPFSSQCKQTDYPLTLNEIELHSQFQTGNFHIADLYQTNHNTDNVISFKPKVQGVFKILVKQPETSEEQTETFDIQIGVFQGKKLLDQEQNHEVRVGKDGYSGRLDYASLELEITQELVGQPLLVYFRSQNFTTTGNEADCQQLYMEVQFQSKETQGYCPSQTSYLPQFDRKLTQLNLNQPQELESLHTNQVESEVIYWQDFHVTKDSDFSLNLEQKFMEHKTLVPLVEIIAEDVKYSEFSYQMHDAPQPQCKINCAFIGHKSYNKFGLQLFVEANSVVRVWLVNVKTYKDVCFSFKMTVELTEPIEEIKEEPRCSLMPLLASNMVIPKYQEDFRFTENAKLDDKNQFTSRFELKELTNVQIRGRPGNYLIQVLQNGKVIATSKSLPLNEKVHSTVPSLYALLDTGSYDLRIQQTKKTQCGQITLDISFSTEDQLQHQTAQLSLLSLLSSKDNQYSYQPSLQQSQVGYNLLLDQIIDFEGLDTSASLIMATEGDIEFVILKQNSNYIYYPRSISQSISQKVLVESINSDSKLRLIMFTRNYQQQQPKKSVYFKASIQLYSDKQESIFTYLHSTKLQVLKTTEELLKCEASSDSTPRQILDNQIIKLLVKPDSLKYEFDFQPTQIRQTRFTIDEAFKIEMISQGKVLGVSKTINGVSELVAKDLSTQRTYLVRVTVNNMHSFLWREECRVVKLMTVSYPSKTPQHYGVAINQIEATSSEQSILVDKNVQITLAQGGDLDIAVDITSVAIPRIYLTQTSNQLPQTGDSKKDLVKELLNEQDSQLLTESKLFKQASLVRYLDLDAGTYTIKLPGTYLLSVRQSRVKQIQTKITRDNELYQSFDYEGVSSKKLPINLNSIQFMKNEVEGYMLYSDYVQVTDGDIQFQVDEDQTWLRIYVENNDIKMVHKLDGVEQKNTQNRHLFNQALAKGSHTITLQPVVATNQTLKTQITISVATPSFLQKYQDFHSDGLLECPQAQFPLALENDKSMLTDAETQAYYNYPHLRYPQSKAEQVTVTTYYFRFNETQRFYYEVGSHFLASHLTLKFSQMNREYVLAYNGKQRGNVNFIDMMVQAGDYQLRIMQYNSQVDKCGIYSMKGMFNPLTAMLMSTQKLHSGQCDVKGDYLPDTIYSSLASTKNGNEDVIEQDGSFLKVYSNVLVDTSMGQTYNHQIEMEVPDKTFVQLTLVASEYHLFTIRLVTSGGRVQQAFHQDVVSTSAAEVKELTLAWYIEPYQTYFLQIQHDNKASQEDCHYFDLVLSVTTVKYLQAKHQCIDTRESLLKVLPDKITKVPFNLTGTYQIQYPQDFETLKGSQMVNADQNNSLVIDTLIESSQEVEIKGRLWQAQALSDFVFGIYEYPETKNDEQLSSLVVQTPTYAFKKGHILGRDLAKVTVEPNQKILLVLQERITSYTLSHLYQSNSSQPLCINLGISFQITPKTKQAYAVPIFNSYSFIGDVASGTSDIIRFSQSTTSVFLQYENAPQVTSDDLKQSLALELLNDDKTILTFMADSVKISDAGATLEFKPSLDSIKELIQKSKATWTVKLQVKEPLSKKFKLSQEFTNQVLSLKPAHNAVIKDEIAEKHQSVKPEPQKAVEVKCECVHGTCAKGQSKCNKCEAGWHGILCDVPNKFQKTAIIDDETILQSVGAKITDSRINEADTYVSRPAPPLPSPVKYVESQSHVQEIRQEQETPVDQGILDNLTSVIVVVLIAYGLYYYRQKALAKQDSDRRRQKKNDYQGILETENEEEDQVIPLELEVINRRRPAPPTPHYQPQEESPPVQQSIENEIDNALSSDDSLPDIDLEQQQPLDSDDDDEFGQFI